MHILSLELKGKMKTDIWILNLSVYVVFETQEQMSQMRLHNPGKEPRINPWGTQTRRDLYEKNLTKKLRSVQRDQRKIRTVVCCRNQMNKLWHKQVCSRVLKSVISQVMKQWLRIDYYIWKGICEKIDKNIFNSVIYFIPY